MFNDGQQFLKTYLSNLHVQVITCEYIECDETWVEDGFQLDFNKLYYICEGEGWVKTGDQEFFPKKGDFVLMPSNRYHAYSYINTNRYKKYWCHFQARVGERDLFDIIKTPLILHMGENEELETIFRELALYSQQDSVSSTLKAKGRLLDLLAFYLDQGEIQESHISKSNTVTRIQQLTHYIEGNLQENLTVEKLANLVHLQPNYFIKFFKLNLGATPLQYVKRRRMKQAIQKLIWSEDSISQIAQDVGYQNMSYFSKDFKYYTGQSPSGYRKKNKR